MAFSIFIHRPDSKYDDIPSEQYHFPKQYLSRVMESEGDWIVYLEPSKVRETKGYFAVCKVMKVVVDPKHEDMFLALIEPGSYLDFGNPVPFRLDDEIIERGLLNERGGISGRAQAAVRRVSSSDFARILDLGLGKSEETLPRVDHIDGFNETLAEFVLSSPRGRIEQLTSRIVRDRNFRRVVIRAYGERCAVTGLRLINGGGRAEVEAAHIKPVEFDGPDIVSNGIALSGTAHWMFDRGLIGLSDSLKIIVSRHTNDPSAIHSMINPSGRLLAPSRLNERPRSEFVDWHRENCYKH